MENFIQNLLCILCGEPFAKRLQKRGRKLQVKVGRCQVCKDKNKEKMRQLQIARNKTDKQRKANSKRMRKNNPMYNRDVVHKVTETNKAAYRSGERVSSFSDPMIKAKAEAGTRLFWTSEKSCGLKKKFGFRMTKSNPMFDPETVEKVRVTLAEGRLSGRITSPRGKDHWLWKGNRPFGFLIRSRLYRSWILPIIARDNFMCTKCGKTNCSLQVHHTTPLATLIDEVLKKEHIDSIKSITSTKKLSRVADLVVSSHSLEDGITLCRKCHAVVDPQYKGKEKYTGFSERIKRWKSKSQKLRLTCGKI